MLQGFRSPVVQAEAIIAAVLLAAVGGLFFGLESACNRARSDCDQVLSIASRIPGL